MPNPFPAVFLTWRNDIFP